MQSWFAGTRPSHTRAVPSLFMKPPTVSVIIPAYNTAPYIAETLTSVFRQTFADFEVIVVNDGSPDTAALEKAIAPFADRIRYIVQENRGLSAARNVGIAAAQGELVALLDSDDVWEPDYLAYQMDVLKRDDLAVVYPNATTFGDPLRSGRLFMDMHPSSGPVSIESLVTQQCNVMVSVLARRDVLMAAGSVRRVAEKLRGLRHVAAHRPCRGTDRLPPPLARWQPSPPGQSFRQRRIDVSAHRARARQSGA